MNDHERRATNEALFRDVNERIAESAERFEADRTEFVCECSDPSCTQRVPATLGEYEQVRTEPTKFLLAPGHEQGDIEDIVTERARYTIVDKVQDTVRRTVIRLDPRSGAAPSES